jgi:hypothetical protein
MHRRSPVRILAEIDMLGCAEHSMVACVARKVCSIRSTIREGSTGSSREPEVARMHALILLKDTDFVVISIT